MFCSRTIYVHLCVSDSTNTRAHRLLRSYKHTQRMHPIMAAMGGGSSGFGGGFGLDPPCIEM